ncbi:MAG: hypothetical protein ACFFBD_12870 [Candidatus Hodarchaeota archaeon]
MRKFWILVGAFDIICLFGAAQSPPLLSIIITHVGLLVPTCILSFILFFAKKRSLEEKGRFLLDIGGISVGLAIIAVISILFLLVTISDSFFAEITAEFGNFWWTIPLSGLTYFGSTIVYPLFPVFLGQKIENEFHDEMARLLEEKFQPEDFDQPLENVYPLERLEMLINKYLTTLSPYYSEGNIQLEARALAYYIYKYGMKIAPRVYDFLFKGFIEPESNTGS